MFELVAAFVLKQGPSFQIMIMEAKRFQSGAFGSTASNPTQISGVAELTISFPSDAPVTLNL